MGGFNDGRVKGALNDLPDRLLNVVSTVAPDCTASYIGFEKSLDLLVTASRL